LNDFNNQTKIKIVAKPHSRTINEKSTLENCSNSSNFANYNNFNDVLNNKEEKKDVEQFKRSIFTNKIQLNTNSDKFERKFTFKIPNSMKNTNEYNVGPIKQILSKKQSFNLEPNDIIADLNNACKINKSEQLNQSKRIDLSKLNIQVVPNKLDAENEQEKSLEPSLQTREPKTRVNVRKGTYLSRLYDDACS
jgi:hypothetical protein